VSVESKTARIVVGIDGSPNSVQALRQAEQIATALNARVEAIACWDYTSPGIDCWDYPSIGIEPLAPGPAGLEAVAKKALSDCIEAAFGTSTPANLSRVLLRAPARPTLIEASRDAVMLVVGRHRRSGIIGLLRRSVSSACISHAHCPVLVVHTAEDSSDLSDHTAFHF
jgi:nucleotide-binding universal stress UspA family protein